MTIGYNHAHFVDTLFEGRVLPGGSAPDTWMRGILSVRAVRPVDQRHGDQQQQFEARVQVEEQLTIISI